MLLHPVLRQVEGSAAPGLLQRASFPLIAERLYRDARGALAEQAGAPRALR